MIKTFRIFWLLLAFIISACGGGGGGGGGSDGSTPVPEELYTLSVTAIGNGTVSYTQAGADGGYKKGEVVVLTAEPSDGWRFDHWEGGVSGIQTTVSTEINSNLSVTAVFIQQFKLVMSKTGNGTVTIDPDLNEYDKDQQVTVTAVPDSGWSFDHWSGSITSTDNPLQITMDADKTITAVFIKPSPLGIEQMKQVLHAAYSGIGYGIMKKYDSNSNSYIYPYTIDDSKLYGIAFDDLRWLSDMISMNSIIKLMNTAGSFVKLLLVAAGSHQSFNLTVNGVDVKLDFIPDGKISNDLLNPSGITVKMTVGIPNSGYEIQNLSGKSITYKGQSSSELIFEGTGKAYFNLSSYIFGLCFESFTITAGNTLSASYENYNVQYKTWTIMVSAEGNEGKKVNYYIGPLMLYEYSEFQSPIYDHRFYKLNGTFSVEGEDYFYDMLYGQFDGRYCPTVVDANAKYIGMQGSIRIPSLDGNLVNISSPDSDLFKQIFNGKGIDSVGMSDLAEAIKITIVPDTGIWKTVSLNMVPAGYTDSWTAVFNPDGSVNIDPGGYTVNSWQTALEFIN
jgi:hypothetical protein